MNARSCLIRGMHEPERYAVKLVYRDQKGQRTRRYVSTIRFTHSGQRVLVLCLCREEPRSLIVERIEHAELVDANDMLMPEDIEVLDSEQC